MRLDAVCETRSASRFVVGTQHAALREIALALLLF